MKEKGFFVGIQKSSNVIKKEGWVNSSLPNINLYF